MGRKISVDSATMMNKALEVIEAKFLFGVEPAKIEVVIHPQSVIHSMVQYVDHSVIAQLGTPDMRGPIAYGLSWPARVRSGAAALDFEKMSALTFESFDSGDHRLRYPGLSLSWQVLSAKPGTPAVLNAANEVGVESFLNGKIRFDQIHTVNAETLQRMEFSSPQSLESLIDIDERARLLANSVMQGLA
jgi:1-deoxy-D-xylulose-5-phosphate reductoisomerase